MTLGPVRVMGAGVVGKHYVEEVNICSCAVFICNWILENRPKYHTRPIEFYWPS